MATHSLFQMLTLKKVYQNFHPEISVHWSPSSFMPTALATKEAAQPACSTSPAPPSATSYPAQCTIVPSNTMAHLLYWNGAEKCLELIAGHILGPGPDSKLTDLLLVALL